MRRFSLRTSSYVWSLLFIIPLWSDSIAIHIVIGAVMFKWTYVTIRFIKRLAYEFEGNLGTQKEFYMLLVQTIHVRYTKKTTIHGHFYFFKSQDIKFSEEILHRFWVGRVPCELAVIKRKARFFTKHQQEFIWGRLFPFFFLPCCTCSNVSE